MTKQKNYKKLIFVLGAIVVIAALLFTLEKLHITNFIHNKSGTSEQGQGTESINFNPPTDEEKKAGDNVDIKKNTPTTTSQTPSQPNTNEVSGSASVAITDANVYNGQVEVRAFVSNMIADGTCTYTFTSGTKTITKTSPAKADASTTNCLTLDFNVSELSDSKKWTVTVKYENQQKTASGSAQTVLTL
jgi:hypothetical protein